MKFYCVVFDNNIYLFAMRTEKKNSHTYRLCEDIILVILGHNLADYIFVIEQDIKVDCKTLNVQLFQFISHVETPFCITFKILISIATETDTMQQLLYIFAVTWRLSSSK
jgi:hypothetical protein